MKRAMYLCVGTAVALALSVAAPAVADVTISPVGGSFTGTIYTGDTLSELYDEDFVSDVTLRGINTNDPTGHTITLNLDSAHTLTGIRYLGDENLGWAQGINQYTLEFFLAGNSQGNFGDSFANSTAWQEKTFSPVQADQVTLRLDSVYSGGVQWGSLSREVLFLPEPTTLGLLALGGLCVLRRRRARGA